MRVKLLSDFVDFYDHYFDVTNYDAVFQRNTTQGPNRIEMLSMLEAMGFDVPAHGIIRRIYEQSLKGLEDLKPEEKDTYLENMKFVVYTDLQAHCGEGKEKVSLREAFEKYPDCFATQYVQNTHNGFGHSIRLLRVGDETHWLEYRSKDDWRSNAGQVDVQTLRVTQGPIVQHIKLPLFAIDFIPMWGGRQKMLAIDLNTAPGLKNTPVEELMKPQEAADAIKKKISELASGW